MLPAAGNAPRVLMLHGLEGSQRSHYVGGILEAARSRGWGAVLVIHRGCGNSPNRARRFYHSGETSDLDLVFRHFAALHPLSRWAMVGVSLGGNMLLKWLGERGPDVDPRVVAAAAISVPFDLEAGARYITTGFARVYDRTFLRSLRRKALLKLERYPGLFDRARLDRAQSIFEFDDAVTAPVHGFASAVDYYTKSSSLGFLPRVSVPTLLLSARDDPFLPAPILARVEAVAAANSRIEMVVTERGGHVGFVEGSWPWRARYFADSRVFGFFDGVMKRASGADYD